MARVCAAAVLVLMVPHGAAEGGNESHHGEILVGHPAASVTGGVTEKAGACDPGSEVNGLDGVWFDLGPEAGATAFLLTMDAALDADVFFFDEVCKHLSTSDGWEHGEGETESGSTPFGTRFAVVAGASGSGTFILSLPTA